MSAPHIPNLLSMSRGGGGLRGRRGRGGPRRPPAAEGHSGASSPFHDKAIQGTDSDAAVSRYSAVSLGYLDDHFAQYFVNGQATRRLPIINRGTYMRTTALDALVDAFIACPKSSPHTPTRQIISLGAGTDTRYFRLRARNNHRNVVYHEFDFPTVVATKFRIVDSNKSILLGDETLYEKASQYTDDTVETMPQWGLERDIDGQKESRYICHPLDLRDLAKVPSLGSFDGIRCGIPTLIISECCLCYLDVDVARGVVKWFTDRIPDLGIVLYEPIGTEDSFGQMMVSNLAARGVVMPTVREYKTLNDQKERLLQLGFCDGQEARDVERVWQEWVSPEEKERVDGLEGLDEVEEWVMLAKHYSLIWGWRGIGFECWKDLS